MEENKRNASSPADFIASTGAPVSMEKSGSPASGAPVPDEFFTNASGQKIYCKYWHPAQGERISTAVFILHGVGEHCGAYERVAAGLTARGLLVCAHDHVGHGRSEGERVHITDFSTYVRDAIQHVDIVKKLHPGIVCFVLGHSMGGAVAVKTALDNPKLFAGVVLIAPAIIADKKEVTPFRVFVAKAVAGIVPQLQVGAIPPDAISRDKDCCQRYVDDPLNWHGGLKAKFAVCLLGTMAEIVRRVEEIEWPFFILHGTNDKLCTLEGSQYLYQKASSKDKLLKIFPGAYHQVHNEPDGQGEEAINDIADWVCRL